MCCRVRESESIGLNLVHPLRGVVARQRASKRVIATTFGHYIAVVVAVIYAYYLTRVSARRRARCERSLSLTLV